MRWEDERYVRLYTRDTPEWCALSWEARALFTEILRKVDRAGILKFGKAGTRGLAALVRIPVQVVDGALEELLEDGCVRRIDGGIVMPNFVPAQETPKSDAARKRDQRERDRAAAMSDGVTVAGDRGGDPRDGSSGDAPTSSRNVTAGHESGQPVTCSVDESREVTPNRAVHDRAEPGEGGAPARLAPRAVPDARAEAAAPQHVREVLDALRAIPELTQIATLRFAKRLGDQCDPIGGRVGVDDVVFAIREAAAKEGAARDVGEAPRAPSGLAGLVMSFVQRVKRGEAQARQAPLRAPAGGDRRAPREPSPQHTLTPEYLEREAKAQAARRAEIEALDAAERARPPWERDPFGPDWEPPPENSDA